MFARALRAVGPAVGRHVPPTACGPPAVAAAVRHLRTGGGDKSTRAGPKLGASAENRSPRDTKKSGPEKAQPRRLPAAPESLKMLGWGFDPSFFADFAPSRSGARSLVSFFAGPFC